MTGVPMIPAAALRRIAAGNPDPYFFSGYNVVDLGLFTLMSSLALFTASRHTDWHRRFMLGAAVALFVAAAGCCCCSRQHRLGQTWAAPCWAMRFWSSWPCMIGGRPAASTPPPGSC